MANIPRNRIRLELDKVERKKLAEIKAKDPSYKDLELYQVAHMELKTRLFDRSREISKTLTPQSPYFDAFSMPPLNTVV